MCSSKSCIATALYCPFAYRQSRERDYRDIPPVTEDFWKNAVRGRFYRPAKQQLTVRVDRDVLEWLKRQGKGYQSRLNAILRREMLKAHQRWPSPGTAGRAGRVRSGPGGKGLERLGIVMALQ